MQVPIHTKDSVIRAGVVCCGSRRRYVRPKAIAASSFLDASMMTRLVIPDPFSNSNREASGVPPQPGDYWLFVQTRRVIDGWPKGGRDLYFKASDLVITSSNIVRITVLQDGSIRYGP
jgi:hypothetical protein